MKDKPMSTKNVVLIGLACCAFAPPLLVGFLFSYIHLLYYVFNIFMEYKVAKIFTVIALGLQFFYLVFYFALYRPEQQEKLARNKSDN